MGGCADSRGRGWRSATRYASMASVVALIGLGAHATQSGATSARTARTLTLGESGHLHLTSHSGFRLNEQGSVSGTIKGTIYIHLNVVAPTRVTAEVSIYPHGGSLTGYAKAAYQVNGATASFSGSLTIRRGTGTYAHASGSGLRFTGTIQRSNDATAVRLSGSMSY